MYNITIYESINYLGDLESWHDYLFVFSLGANLPPPSKPEPTKGETKPEPAKEPEVFKIVNIYWCWVRIFQWSLNFSFRRIYCYFPRMYMSFCEFWSSIHNFDIELNKEISSTHFIRNSYFAIAVCSGNNFSTQNVIRKTAGNFIQNSEEIRSD